MIIASHFAKRLWATVFDLVESMLNEMRLGFAQKLMCLTMLPLLVAQLGTLYGVISTTEKEVRNTARQNVAIGTGVAEKFLSTRSDNYLRAVDVLASDFALKEVLAYDEPESIRSALANHSTRIGADIAAFFFLDDDEPIVVESARSTDFETYVIEHRDTFDEPKITSSLLLNEEVYQLYSVPVRAPEPIGYLTFGVRIGDSVLAELKQLTGLDVALICAEDDYTVARSTDSVGDGHTWVAEKKPGQSVYTTEFADAEYLTASTQLTNGNHELIVALRLSVAKAMAPYDSAKYWLVLFSLCVLVIVAALGLLFARSIARPLRDLSHSAELMADGSYDGVIELSSDDEVGGLADSFRAMQSAIADREASITHRTLHDSLTELPNQTALYASTELLLGTNESETRFSLVCLQLANFSTIASSIGPVAADKLVIKLAEIMQAGITSEVKLYHTGTHEFFLCVSGTAEVAMMTAERIVSQLATGVSSQQQNILLHAHAGVCSYPNDGGESDLLVRRAKIAAVEARTLRLAAQRFQPESEEQFERQMRILNDLPGAIADRQISVIYQPKISLASGACYGSEALVRWQHPQLGNIRPDEFIPIAEQSGSIALLTRFVLDQALEALARWQSGQPELKVAVNLSARDLLQDGLVRYVRGRLEKYGVTAECLILEVTETSIMENVEHSVATLERLRRLGIRISIDDFGTGQSSLSQLHTLPVDELKIDKGFVIPMMEDSAKELLTSTTIELAHKFGLTVVAEGVENQYSMFRLAHYGCEVAQGYFISKPLAEPDFVSWLASHKPKEYLERRGEDRPFQSDAGVVNHQTGENDVAL